MTLSDGCRSTGVLRSPSANRVPPPPYGSGLDDEPDDETVVFMPDDALCDVPDGVPDGAPDGVDDDPFGRSDTIVQTRSYFSFFAGPPKEDEQRITPLWLVAALDLGYVEGCERVAAILRRGIRGGENYARAIAEVVCGSPAILYRVAISSEP